MSAVMFVLMPCLVGEGGREEVSRGEFGSAGSILSSDGSTVKGKARVAHLLAGGFRDDGGDGGDPRAALAVIAAFLLLASLRHGATGSDDWACQKRILRDARTDTSFHPASRLMSPDTLRQHRHARQIWP